jgi:ribosomal protein L29
MAKKISYTDKSVPELQKLAKEKREELRKLRFSAAGARAKNPNEPMRVRREIARILTEMENRRKVHS